MQRFQQIIVAREVLDGGWRNDRYGQRRMIMMNVAELDEIADITWRWSDLKRAVAVRASAVRARWRSGPSSRRDASAAVPAEARRAT